MVPLVNNIFHHFPDTKVKFKPFDPPKSVTKTDFTPPIWRIRQKIWVNIIQYISFKEASMNKIVLLHSLQSNPKLCCYGLCHQPYCCIQRSSGNKCAKCSRPGHPAYGVESKLALLRIDETKHPMYPKYGESLADF